MLMILNLYFECKMQPAFKIVFTLYIFVNLNLFSSSDFEKSQMHFVKNQMLFVHEDECDLYSMLGGVLSTCIMCITGWCIIHDVCWVVYNVYIYT